MFVQGRKIHRVIAMHPDRQALASYRVEVAVPLKIQ